VEGITEYRLSNGLRVLLFPDPSKPTVTVNVTYLVGSRHEGYGESGMAHLLEHLQFRGTPRHPHILQELTAHGASPNGTTWLDRTNYYETFPATPANLAWALDLEADRMGHSVLARQDLAKEFSVVRNELEMGENSPSNVLEERVLSTAYLWHNYGKSTIGSKEDIEQVPVASLRAFYRKYYQPDNAVLLVAGKFDPRQALLLIKQHFGRLARPSRVLPTTYTTEPVQDGERNVTLRRPGDVQGLAVAYHVMAGAHLDYAATAVLVEALAGQPAGRLYQALVDSRHATSLAGAAPFLHDPGFAYFSAEVRQGRSLDSARTVLLGVLANLSKQPLTAEEVARAKTKLLKDIEVLRQKSDALGVALSEYIAAGDWRLLFLHRDRLRQVQVADVQRVASAYLKPSNRTSGTFIPATQLDRSPQPSTPDVAALVRNYRSETAIAVGEYFDASPANIDARTKLGTEKNGLKYALLQKQNRGNTVVLELKVRYGSEATLANKATVADLTAAMLNRGTTTRTYAQLQEALDQAQSRVLFYTRAAYYGSGQTAALGIQTDKAHLTSVLDLALDCLRHPAFPAEELEKLKQERLAALEAQRQDPQALGFNLATRLSESYPPGHPLATRSFEAEIAAIQAVRVADVRAFYEQFYGAQNATLAVAGSFDEAALRQRVATQLGDWRARMAYVRIPLRLFASPAQSQSLQTPDKANALFISTLQCPVRDDSPDYAALYLANYMLGGGFATSRLTTRLRQQEGLSYGVGSFLQADDTDQVATFTAYALYNPDNSARLEQAFKEELMRFAQDGVTAAELAAAKVAARQSMQGQRAQDISLTSAWVQYLAKPGGRTFAYDAELDRRLAALTPEQVRAAARKYLDYSKLTIVKAGDFARKAQSNSTAP
jgi:zinc protease